MPSGVVAKALFVRYRAWLNKPGKGGKAHKAHDMRRFRKSYSDLDLPGYGDGWLDLYADAWELIAASDDAVEARAPSSSTGPNRFAMEPCDVEWVSDFKTSVAPAPPPEPVDQHHSEDELTEEERRQLEDDLG